MQNFYQYGRTLAQYVKGPASISITTENNTPSMSYAELWRCYFILGIHLGTSRGVFLWNSGFLGTQGHWSSLTNPTAKFTATLMHWDMSSLRQPQTQSTLLQAVPPPPQDVGLSVCSKRGLQIWEGRDGWVRPFWAHPLAQLNVYICYVDWVFSVCSVLFHWQ